MVKVFSRFVPCFSKRNPASRGLTLAEVTVALGLISFSVISLMALLPIGLEVVRESMSDTVQAQIVQEVSADVALTRFDELPSLTTGSSPLLYNNDGLRVRDLGASNYQVFIEVEDPAPFPGTPPGMAGSLRSVEVLIFRRPGGVTTEDPPKRVSLLIANGRH